MCWSAFVGARLSLVLVGFCKPDHSFAKILNLVVKTLFNQGLEVAKRQIIDVVNGINTYQNNINKFHNIIGYVKKGTKKVIVEFRAEYYMEPHSKYLILVDNEKEELSWKLQNKGMFFGGFNNEIKLDNGHIFKGISMSDSEATSPGFPFVVELTQQQEKEIKVLSLMRDVSEGRYETIPLQMS